MTGYGDTLFRMTEWVVDLVGGGVDLVDSSQPRVSDHGALWCWSPPGPAPTVVKVYAAGTWASFRPAW